MSDNVIRSDYHFIPYPYISKSGYTLFSTCKYKFKRIILDRVPMEENDAMKIGTALHYLFYKFYDWVDIDLLWDMDYQQNYNTKYSQVYTYFFGLFAPMIPENMKNLKMLQAIKSFCRFQENHWYDIRQHFKNKIDVTKYWRPMVSERECFVRNDDFQMYGTIDVIFHEPEVSIIFDHKVRKPPKKLKEEMRRTEYTSCDLGKYTAEGAFYAILYLSRMGYNFRYNKEGKIDIYKGDTATPNAFKKLDMGFGFFGEYGISFPSYYIARKQVKMISIRTIFKNLEKIRNCREFPMEPNEYKCRYRVDGKVKYCQFFESECSKAIPNEIYGNIRRSEDSPQKNLPDMDGSEDGSEQMDYDN